MALAILIYLAFMTVLGVVLNVASVGKPRGPLTPGVAAGTAFLGMLHMLCYVYLSTRV